MNSYRTRRHLTAVLTTAGLLFALLSFVSAFALALH
jgi:hypothetical protein